MDILTVVIVFLVLEAVICGVCGFVYRERHLPPERDKQTAKTSLDSTPHPSRITHALDHQGHWSHASDQQVKRHESNIRLTYVRPNILP